MKYLTAILATAACIVAAGPAFAQAKPDTPKPPRVSQAKPDATKKTPAAAASTVSAADAAFAKQAAMDGMAEVEHGRLASDKASNADVKAFGARMVTDHGKANDELKSWASSNNVTLPADMGAQHKAMQAKLEKMSGDAFDRAYMAHMVAAHAKAVAAFQRASKTAKNADLKTWATNTLPTLQDHHKTARDLNTKVAGAAAPKKTGK